MIETLEVAGSSPAWSTFYFFYFFLAFHNRVNDNILRVSIMRVESLFDYRESWLQPKLGRAAV